ncbi:N-acetylneuraminate synthase [Aliivibrio fischeri]|uniref:N-acetylneuraminate synthase family protein n=1 Tax=Aliivibrio fischeri TaxID=668 RepID=UPI00107EC15E|nr:N-acetylneuraminate synthase family protein [Aliivibrio fischeri]MUH96842.1 N-acetylneuraminate synthase [Aliivibrio fischeri]MUI63821.1 N-acetylneuraminate synthase [Aliivibrio fischeri]TGA73359.1 N-acetylneuraminate synthase [Aliivibrio fischeri]
MSNIKDILHYFSLSGKNKIAIIGKGASLDLIDLSKLNDFFIININDSEKALSGDVCIYHLSWVSEFLINEGGKCQYYISSCEAIDGIEHVSVEHIYEGPENVQPLQERFFDSKFYIEDATVISALKLSNLCADYVRNKLDVYLLGFDFSISTGYSKKSGGHVSFGEYEYVESLLNNQSAYLELILSHEADLSINVNHIGDRSFSSMNCEKFNLLTGGYSDAEQVNDVKSDFNHYKGNNSVIVVAEITTNHFGNLDLLHKMIKAAAEAGADYIKLQKRDVETFYTQEELNKPYQSPFGNTFRDYRHGLELDEAGFQKVEEWCNKYGIKWFASVLDKKSYDFMLQFEPELIKLPSTISEHIDFLKAVAEDFKGDIVLSTGMTDSKYEEFVLSEFHNCRYLYLLQCVSTYPTMNEDANVAVVRHYHDLSKKFPNIKPGYSSHDVGSLCCQLSVAAGALMVEKHVKYGNTPWAHFDNVAIDMLTGNFKKFVDDVRLAELCLGSGTKVVLNSEHHKYRK